MAETPDFEQLLAEYHAPLGRLCYFYFAGDPDAQKDLYQEISIAIWRALPGYRGEASVRTWLYRVAHNVALTHRRKQRRHAGLFKFSDPAELTRRPAPQSDAVADDRWLALRSAIFELAAEDRQLMLLHLEGLSLAEIEAVSGIRAGTVATRLSRLRVRLSERLRGKEARP